MFNDNGSFLLAMFEFFLFFAWIMCVFYVFADIFRSDDMGGGAKTIWIIFIILVPFLGVFVYLIARGGGMTKRSMEQQQQLRAQQEEYVRSVVATSGGGSSVDQIASAKKLLDDGSITQAEFDQLKSQALGTA
ncbi:SHOCT domain-containing protein [Monashia sp. NPDC004114]